MNSTKQKLIDLVMAIQEENIIDYCYTFIGLKVYGKAKLPEKILVDLRKLYDEYLVHCGYVSEDFSDGLDDDEEPKWEPNEEEILAEDYRCSIIEILYSIESPAILDYIRILAEDIAEEDRGIGLDMPSERRKAIQELVKVVINMKNTAKIRFLLPIVEGYGEGGATHE